MGASLSTRNSTIETTLPPTQTLALVAADSVPLVKPTDGQIRGLLPPELLLKAFKQKIEGEKGDRVNITRVGQINSAMSGYLPALLSMSTWGLDQALSVNFLGNGVLPPPESPDFPELALGLILILDQGPRFNFSGIDSRYTFDYFGAMALKLVTQFRNLPPHLVPYNRDLWIERGYSTDQWAFALLWFLAPITHSEDLSNHHYQVGIWDAAKVDIRRANGGMEDPYAQRLKEGLGDDALAFAREFKIGPPAERDGRPASFVDFIYWFAMIFNVHRPIIATFGHYPYRNTSQGRINTSEEKDWLVQTGYFGAVTNEEDGKKVREDVVAGRWSPLIKKVDAF
ncbi:MAG: hypothetical protein TREMPRED_001438 [Tremellales sp. Tagirdzhanova-0007]|nr:MAG: hypothetical protein TREMPRED_001438 [Tremellales sp. Tagirdzhanova-0007]